VCVFPHFIEVRPSLPSSGQLPLNGPGPARHSVRVMKSERETSCYVRLRACVLASGSIRSGAVEAKLSLS